MNASNEMKIAKYLGRDTTDLLASVPFKNWPVERSVEDDLDERVIHYVFHGKGMEIRSDSQDRICVIFLHSTEYGGLDEQLIEIPFSLSQHQVLDRFGTPSKSGKKFRDSILGECGAWDRFELANWVMHVEYRIDADEINKITLIRKGPNTRTG